MSALVSVALVENKGKELKAVNKTCQMTMSDNGRITGVAAYWECGKPAKAWIVDRLGRVGSRGRLYLCGVHARAYDRVAKRTGKPLAIRL